MDRATKLSLMKRLNRDAKRIAARFDLRYRSIEAERANVTSRYGICYEDGVIKIRLRHAVTGEPLRYSSLVNTLCHELAHLRHFNHGERFRVFYRDVLEFARAERIYRPQARRTDAGSPLVVPVEPARPVQLSLF
jgi:predicted metal-dependent hydrolase